jgi:hypothetical protein
MSSFLISTGSPRGWGVAGRLAGKGGVGSRAGGGWGVSRGTSRGGRVVILNHRPPFRFGSLFGFATCIVLHMCFSGVYATTC